MNESSFVRNFLVSALLIGLCVPGAVYAQGSGGFLDTIILIMYGIVGFFGALAFGYFFGGWVVYLSRMGQEYRIDGIYIMITGTRILFYVLCAIVLLKIIE